MKSLGKNCPRWLLSAACVGALLITRAPAASDPQDLTGTWQGIWKRADGDARTVLKISRAGLGRQGSTIVDGTLYLVDLPGISIHLGSLTLRGSTIKSFSVDRSSAVRSGYEGTLSAGGNTIAGFLIQEGIGRELDLTRVTPGIPAWEIRTPTPEELHQYLEVSYNRSLLIADNAAPFHVVARISLFKSEERSPSSYATLDEIWRDPLHWKSTITYGGSTFTEVDNGANAYAIGEMPMVSLCCVPKVHERDPFNDVIPRAEEALFSPFRPELLATRRLTLKGRSSCDPTTGGQFDCTCIKAEPELTGVSDAVPAAETTYCLAYDLTLHSATYPVPTGWVDPVYDYSVDRYDVAPFGAKDIARTVDVKAGDGRMARVRITTLEPATDLSALNAPIPVGANPIGANRGEAHRQDAPLAGEVMTGQVISAPDLHSLLCRAGLSKGVMLKLHIDASGEVTGSDVLSDPEHVMTPAAFEAVKEYRYRASYQGEHPVGVDRIVWTGPCVY
jgi:hypothetical protein